MEETLTNCLVRGKEDLSQLEKVRTYLQENAETEECCSFTWRTIEAFNSILSVCSSQSTPETNALDTLLDSFYYMARNNNDNSVWDNFGFELGIICVKVLSAIERTKIFEVLFSKLLSLITVMCEHNSGIWKAASRQILNVLINKKFSLHYFESILKSYICMIRNVDSFVLYDFSSQNLSLLKTLSLMVQRVGDFEIQSDIVETIFVHLSKDTKLMCDFFTTTDNKLFQTLQFRDFEGDCRLFLNAINKPRREIDRKVYSICCHVLYFGGCFVEPPIGRTHFWVDANKDTERVSIKCGDIASNENRVIYVQFSELVSVHFDNDKAEGRCITIRTKNLIRMYNNLRNDDICLVVESADGLQDFLNFLEAVISEKKRKKPGMKASKTVDCLFIDIRTSKLQDNAITSSDRGDVLPLGKINRSPLNELQLKSSQPRTPTRKPLEVQNISGGPELSPNSFAQSFNKNVDSLESKHTFEDSVKTVEFLQHGTPRKSHKLFRNTDEVFNIFETDKSENFKFIFEEKKENSPPVAAKTHRRESQPPRRESPVHPSARLLTTESQDCFRGGPTVLRKKKPCLPKLKRTKRGSNESTKENVSFIESIKSQSSPQNIVAAEQPNKTRPISKIEIRGPLKQFRKKIEIAENRQRNKQKPSDKVVEKEKVEKTRKILIRKEKESKPESGKKKQTGLELLVHREEERVEAKAKPSLLDPNGYAYKRWCKPTTSERSNFWLKKLKVENEKPKTDSIFEFEDFHPGSSVKKKKEKKRKPVISKQVRRTRETSLQEKIKRVEAEKTALRLSKEFLKKPPQKEKPTESLRIPNSPPSLPPPEEPLVNSVQFECSSIDGASDKQSEEHGNNGKEQEDENIVEEDAGTVEEEDSEPESISDDEPPFRSKKRDRSDEDSSTSRTCLKKKPKTSKILSSKVLTILRHRLQKAEERDRHQTNQIIQTVHEAVDRLIDRLQAKEGVEAKSCLETIATASTTVDREIDDVSLRAKRIQRAILYFKTGCSVSDFCKTLEDQFTRVRASLMAFRRKRDTSKAVDRVADRLSCLIKSAMEVSIKDEWKSQQDFLLKCACFETDFTFP